MHTHFSSVHVLNIGLAVLIFGTLWRLLTMHAIAKGTKDGNDTLTHLGKAMAFQL